MPPVGMRGGWTSSEDLGPRQARSPGGREHPQAEALPAAEAARWAAGQAGGDPLPRGLCLPETWPPWALRAQTDGLPPTNEGRPCSMEGGAAPSRPRGLGRAWLPFPRCRHWQSEPWFLAVDAGNEMNSVFETSVT